MNLTYVLSLSLSPPPPPCFLASRSFVPFLNSPLVWSGTEELGKCLNPGEIRLSVTYQALMMPFPAFLTEDAVYGCIRMGKDEMINHSIVNLPVRLLFLDVIQDGEVLQDSAVSELHHPIIQNWREVVVAGTYT